MALPLELQRTLQLKPLGIVEGQVLVAPLYPLTDTECQQISASENGLPVLQEPCDRSAVHRYLRGISASLFSALSNGDYAAGFSASLLEAIEANASDLHIRMLTNGEPCHMRRRIHGYLQEALPLDIATARRFVTWAKQKAGLDSSDHLHPQEGRFSLQANQVTVEFRVSCSGQTDGETMVIRLLDPRRRLSLQALCTNPALGQCLEKLVDIETKQGGLVLVSGPTGAGKTTTLAALTGALPLDRLKAVAIEDPVEIRTEGVDHLEVDSAQGLGFAQLLRAVLRQDPDIIIIGEIRDAETAEIALRAVETGHWVMASVHAGSVVETIYRLTSLLPPSYEALGRLTLQTRLHAVINQLLVPIKNGRQLSMEALFAEPYHAALPWFEADPKPATFPGCSYFPRA
jgi:type II secretory ATPase GspE/PulE/Tfp pilus assembly ATPase PilB-like protein